MRTVLFICLLLCVHNFFIFFLIRAAIDGADYVSMKYLESARDKVLMGPQRRARIPDEEANCITAYHEGGHAVVAFYTKDSHPLHKVITIYSYFIILLT